MEHVLHALQSQIYHQHHVTASVDYARTCYESNLVHKEEIIELWI